MHDAVGLAVEHEEDHYRGRQSSDTMQENLLGRLRLFVGLYAHQARLFLSNILHDDISHFLFGPTHG